VDGPPPAGTGPVLRWAVLPQNVLLVRPDKPRGSHLENAIPARVEEVMELGAEGVVWLRPQGLEDTGLQMRLPTRALQRYAVVAGTAVTVCLRSADIVLLGNEPAQAAGS
jgi:molybdate transport system ATP-binding protein